MAAVLHTAVLGLGKAALDMVLPPRCLSCGAPVAETGTLCGQCWAGLTFISAPRCLICGIPFVYELPDETLCGQCQRRPPRYDRARAVLRYDVASRGLVIAFKHADRTDAAPTFAAWLQRAAGDILDDGPLLMPVPLHPARLRARRYNQSALLAARLARIAGLDWSADGLVRTRRTRSQGRLGADERRRNVRGAFALSGAGRAAAAGRRVVLIDDVLTTGATVEACARPLRAGGAEAVDVLTLTRVTALGATDAMGEFSSERAIVPAGDQSGFLR